MIWLTGVSRADLTVPELGRAEHQSPLLLLPGPSWLFSNEIGGQGAVTHTGVPDTWKWDPIRMLGLRRKTGKDREGEGAQRGIDGEEEGGPPAVRWLSDRSRKVAEQQNSSKDLWVTRDERHISAYTAPTATPSVWLVSVIWQAYKDQSCSTQGLVSSQEYQQNVYWSALRTSESLITSTKSVSSVFLIQTPPSTTQVWF